VDEYTQEMKSLLSKFISHQFPIPSSSTDSTGKQSLKSLEKSCQGLTAEVAEHETSKQVLERVKRTAITQVKTVFCHMSTTLVSASDGIGSISCFSYGDTYFRALELIPAREVTRRGLFPRGQKFGTGQKKSILISRAPLYTPF